MPDFCAAEGGTAPAGGCWLQICSLQTYRPSTGLLRAFQIHGGTTDLFAVQAPVTPKEVCVHAVLAGRMARRIPLPLALPPSTWSNWPAWLEESGALTELPQLCAGMQQSLLAAPLDPSGLLARPRGPALDRIARTSLPVAERLFAPTAPQPASGATSFLPETLAPIVTAGHMVWPTFQLAAAGEAVLTPQQAPELAGPLSRQPAPLAGTARAGTPARTTAGAWPANLELWTSPGPEAPPPGPDAAGTASLIPAAAQGFAGARLAGEAGWIQAAAMIGIDGLIASSITLEPSVAGPAGLQPNAQAGSASPAIANQIPTGPLVAVPVDPPAVQTETPPCEELQAIPNRCTPALTVWPAAAGRAASPTCSAEVAASAVVSVPVPSLPAPSAGIGACSFAPPADVVLHDAALIAAGPASLSVAPPASNLPEAIAMPLSGVTAGQDPALASMLAAGFAVLPADIAAGPALPASTPVAGCLYSGSAILPPPEALAGPAVGPWRQAAQTDFAALVAPAVLSASAAGRDAIPAAAPEAWLPEFTFPLAQPPVPYPADLSPEAVASTGVPIESGLAASPVEPSLPPFSLLALLPAIALPPAVAPPSQAYPAMAGLTPAAGFPALPPSPLRLEAAGLETLIGAVPGLPDAHARRVPGSAAAWIPEERRADQLAIGSGAAGPMAAPAAGGLPSAHPPQAATLGSGARFQFAPAAFEGMPDALPVDSSSLFPLEADPIPVEFYVQRGRPAPYSREQWHAPRPEVCLPRMTVHAVPVALDQMALRKGAQPDVPRISRLPRYSRSSVALWGKGMAAGVAVCAFLWFGSQAIRMERTEARAAAAKRTGADPMALPAPPLPSTGGGGVVASVRRAIVGRAKVEVGSDFRTGSQFWDGGRPNWGKGWERHRDGYTRPGALALLRPSLQLTDYRMEFMGQIENKSMSWVVRAHDVDNYYAMKLNVVAPGLRPIVSVVRYPVVNGKRGRKVEIPLPLMIHNSTPYRVAVDVRGNRFVTSVEGEQVDSWTDETLAAGGVGFFSDGAERARLYWVRVTNNDDLLGRICAYISGRRGSGQEVAFTAGHGADDQSGGRRPATAVALLPRAFRRTRTAPGWAHSG